MQLPLAILACVAAASVPRESLAANPNVTTSLLWPLPSNFNFGTGYFTIDPSSFQFMPRGLGASGTILQAALERYGPLIFQSPIPFIPGGDPGSYLGVLPQVYVDVLTANETLGPYTNETCELLPSLSQ